MDSSGFCTSGDVHNPPSWDPNPQSTPTRELRPMQPSNVTAVSTSAGQPKLEVEFGNGLLRIVAEHISMRDVLRAISGHTGAEMEFPAGALAERVFVHLGPGTPQEVLSQLLKGSDFNYVILSSNSEPGGIARVILTRSSNAAHETPSSSSVVVSENPSSPELYGGGFSAEGDSTAVDLVPTQLPPTADPAAAVPTANWVHHDGAILSGEQLDQMQKSTIQQEQQQFAEELKQQRQQQQEQGSQDTPQQ
jgi:hypothetical protein